MADRAEVENQRALDRAIEITRRRIHGGRSDCIECGELIAPLRTELGAIRCLHHQSIYETTHRR